jgi:hypothetical protein
MGTCFSIADSAANNAEDTLHIVIEDTTGIANATVNNNSNHNSNNNSPITKYKSFDDIIDEKHIKYMKHYHDSTVANEVANVVANTIKKETLFWGIGIENESYLMFTDKYTAPHFRKLQQKRERYSVDYFKSFSAIEPLLQQLCTHEQLTYPMYINSHTFQATDIKQRHRTHYDVGGTPNAAFTESLHQLLLRECEYYRQVFNESLVFDGDSIEFITQDFYCATVDRCVEELRVSKQRFLAEIAPYFQKWFSKTIAFPDHNYGLVSFFTTQNRNLGICNNGTIHINLTLPTVLENGCIKDKAQFLKQHLAFIPYLQRLEPLLVACYGTPDVFSLLAEEYAVGSQRVALSRYISLQTFDAAHPVHGKQLLMDRPKDPAFWQNVMTTKHPYCLNDKIGYDINFNKFKNHGIEVRFFDWFPEEHLADIIHLFILLAQHSQASSITPSIDQAKYSNLIYQCVTKGFSYRLSSEE